MLEYLKRIALQPHDLDIQATKYYIGNFISHNSIVMIYSKPKQGKTFLAYGVCKHILESDPNLKTLVYLDLDNGKRTLKERNMDTFLEKFPKIHYITRSKLLPLTAHDLLKEFQDNAKPHAYDDWVIVMDGASNFVKGDIGGAGVTALMNTLMILREAGATIIIIHHSTKNGKQMEGSGDFYKFMDSIYGLSQIYSDDESMSYHLEAEIGRGLIDDIGFKVNTKTFDLEKLENDLFLMSEYEREFTTKGKAVLKANPTGVNKAQFLKGIGFERTDVTARDTLEKFIGKFWKSEKVKNQYILTPISPNPNTSTTTPTKSQDKDV